MFNSPVLDIAIGLVFIFLLYSLLATSVNETIATTFALRASMLKKGIVENMLSDTPNDVKLVSIGKGILDFFKGIPQIFGLIPAKKEDDKRLGDKFYDHPMIKNYGASRIFPHPSYLPSENFSTVLIDLMKQQFESKLAGIASFLKKRDRLSADVSIVENELRTSSDAIKFRALLAYYQDCYTNNPDTKCFIDKETTRIIQMHLENSLFDMADFTKRLEKWFDDTMDRISGWYKRQTHTILFMLGLLIAFTFNVDTIAIAGKLSTDKDARDKLVNMAIKKVGNGADEAKAQASEENVRRMLEGDVNDANTILATGWATEAGNNAGYIAKICTECWSDKKCDLLKKDYDKVKDSVHKGLPELLRKNEIRYAESPENSPAKNLSIADEREKGKKLIIKNSSKAINNVFYEKMHKMYGSKAIRSYMFYSVTSSPRKLLSFMLLAFGICLGAPFWFDMLSKLVRVRGTGTKEITEGGSGDSKALPKSPANTININTQTPGEEAVG